MTDYYRPHTDGRDGGWCVALTYMNYTGNNVVRCEPGEFKSCRTCSRNDTKSSIKDPDRTQPKKEG